MPGAGDLRDRYRLERRAVDDNGDRRGPWESAGERWARTTWLRGGEGVLAQRLEGTQPVAITVRDDSVTRQVTNAWRAVARDGRVFDVTSASPARERGFIDLLAVLKAGEG